MNAYLILPLVQVGFSLILIPIVLRRHYQNVVNRLFSFYLLGLAAWGMLIFSMRSSPGLEQAYSWEKWLFGLVPLLAVLFYHFSVRHTRTYINKWLLPSGYIVCAIFIALSQTDLIIKGMQLKPYGYAPIGGPLFLPVVLSGCAFMIIALINFLKANKATTFAEEKNRNTYISIGVTFSLIGGAFDLLPLLGLPLYPGVIIGNIIFCLITTVAIVKHHLLDIHLIIRKGTAYLLMSTIVAIPYVGIIILFNKIFEEVISTWAYFFLILVLAVALQPLWSRVQRLVDRWFYRERYDYLEALNDFTEKTHDISDLRQLSSSLVKLVSKALQSADVYLLLRTEQGYSQISSSISENSIQLTLKSQSPLIRWLRDNQSLLNLQDLNIIPQMQALTSKESNELAKRGVELIVPLKTRKNELIGLLLLGKKLSDQMYSEEDKQLISMVADRIAIELENARLYSLERIMCQELEKEVEQKTVFLHNLAHELKTPLTAIISSSEILGTESSSDISTQDQRLIRNIKYSAWLMNKRVTELLNLAKMQIGNLEFNPEPLEFGVVIEETVSQLLPVFGNKEQSLKLEMPDSLPIVKADREKLEQILFNLLSNANKFSSTKSNIALRVKEVGDSVVVEVKDSAPAIAERDKEKLFDPYYRGEDAHKRQRIPGLGLGLAISKKLVELHQGRIWCESEPGIGNTFAFSIPTNSRGIERTSGLISSSHTAGDKVESVDY